MALTKIGASLGGGADTISVTQANHGLAVGRAVKVTGNGTYGYAKADTAPNAEAIGIIVETTTNTMLIALSGKITVDGAIPSGNLAAGTVVFLSATSNVGELTSAEPTTAGHISKPMGVITYLNSEMIMIQQRGEVISTGGAAIADGSITLAKMAVNSIDSDQYVNGSIDEVHFATDAVSARALASGSVGTSQLATNQVNEERLQISNAGTDGQFLQKQSGNSGGLTWAAPGGGYDECARVYSDSTQSFANGATDAIAFNQERFDTDAIHDNSTNNTRLTCKTAGVYVISGTIQWEYNTSATHRRLGIIKYDSDGSNGVYIDFVSKDESPATGHKMTITTIYKLAVNEFVTLVARQNRGGALTTTVNANHSPEFAMARIGIG